MPILPGSTIGILGGGQLGRMTAMAAREMGYRVRALDPDPNAASRYLVEEQLTASFEDEDAAERLAKSSDVVTIEIEKVGTKCLERAARFAPTRPGAELLRIVQDRALQKEFLTKKGFPLGPYRTIESEAQLASALGELDGKTFVKVARGGYDGRGQFETQNVGDASEAFKALGGERCVVEKALPIEMEISVMCARSPSGEIAVYQPAQNHHVERILAWSALPAAISDVMRARAMEIGREVTLALEAEGLVCLELFVVGGDLYVNELAPRPHNSYHASVVGAATSQFEQHVRAICDLPLGSVEIVKPAAIANILGDLWKNGETPAFDRALAHPGVRLHLYGKTGAKPGRKMGHLSATASTTDEATRLVQEAIATI
jgi:5-(carboxyamino)imidazole ribonucleotide synthase